MGGGVAIFLIVLTAVFLLVVIKPFDAAITPPPTLDSAAQPAAQAVIAPGEVGVLVAQLEQLGGNTRSASGFIVEDLRRSLETTPFSNIRVHEYRGRVASPAEAIQAAEDIGAAVIVWGSDDGEEIILNVEIGVTASFPHIGIDRDKLEAVSNVRARMTDPRRESVARPVLGVLNTLYIANGDGFDLMRNLALGAELNTEDVELLDDTLAVHTQQFYNAYFHDIARAGRLIDETLNIDPAHPVLYINRGAQRLIAGDFEGALQDAQSAQRLGPDDWVEPLYIFVNIALFDGDIDTAITHLNRIIARRSDDWFPVYTRGSLHYLKGDYALAQADIDRALALDPQANFPYAFALMLALRDGRIDDTEALIGETLDLFPNPTLGNRILTATFGEDLPKNFPIDYGNTLSAFGNVLLGQYEAAIDDAEAALVVSPDRAELYMIQGLAHCNLRDYAAAEMAYSRAIENDPDLAVLYLLRAEARKKLGGTNLVGALSDFAVARRAELGDEFAQLVEDGFNDIVTCENFLDAAA